MPKRTATKMIGKRSTAPTTAATFTEPLCEPLEQYRVKVLRHRVMSLRLHILAGRGQLWHLNKPDYVELLREHQRSDSRAGRKPSAVVVSDNDGGHSECDDSVIDSSNISEDDDTSVSELQTTGTRKRRDTSTHTRRSSSKRAKRTTTSSHDPSAALEQLQEPLEQYNRDVLRRAAKQLRRQYGVHHSGPWYILTKDKLIDAIREHWRTEGRARRMHATATIDVNDSSDDVMRSGDGVAKNSNSADDIVAISELNVTDSQRDAATLYQQRCRSHGDGRSLARSSVMDVEIAALQRSYWTTQIAIAQQQLATEQLVFAMQHSKLFGRSR